jgi:small subunit ribosomal protein S4
LVTHRHVTVDGKMCNIPSAMVKPGQVIGLREKSKSLTAVQDSLNKHRVTVSWLEWNQASQTGSMTSLPERSEIPENINVQAIVELYSR